MNTFNTIEAVVLLESFATKRTARLSKIATDRLLKGYGWPVGDKYTIALEHQNMLDDTEMRFHFLQRGNPFNKVKELHLKRCEESGVEYCICLADKKI